MGRGREGGRAHEQQQKHGLGEQRHAVARGVAAEETALDHHARDEGAEEERDQHRERRRGRAELGPREVVGEPPDVARDVGREGSDHHEARGVYEAADEGEVAGDDPVLLRRAPRAMMSEHRGGSLLHRFGRRELRP